MRLLLQVPDAALASYPNPWDNECAGIFSFGVETVYAILVLPRFRYPSQDWHQEPPRRARARALPSLSPPPGEDRL